MNPLDVTCSAEPHTAVATLRSHRTEVKLFRWSPPPPQVLIAAFFASPSSIIVVSNCDPVEHVNYRNVNSMRCDAGQRLYVALIKRIQGGEDVGDWRQHVRECCKHLFLHFSQFCPDLLLCWSLLLLNLEVILSLFRYPLHVCFFSFSKESTHIRVSQLPWFQ